MYLCDMLWYLRSSSFSLPGILCLPVFSSVRNNISAVLICGSELVFQFICPHCEIPVLIYSLWTVVFPDMLTSTDLHVDYIQCSRLNILTLKRFILDHFPEYF